MANGNYRITAQNGTFIIDQRPITATADAKSKTYGNADPALTYQVTSGNLVGNDSLNGALTRTAGENVGNYTIDASALVNGNYLITAQNGVFIVKPAPLANSSSTPSAQAPTLASGSQPNAESVSPPVVYELDGHFLTIEQIER